MHEPSAARPAARWPALAAAQLRIQRLAGRLATIIAAQLRVTDKYGSRWPAFNQCLLHVFGQDSQLCILRIDSPVFATALVPLSLPPRLQLLDLSRSAHNSAFTAGVLPPSLLRLRLGAEYRTAFTADSFTACQRLRELDLKRCSGFCHPLAGVLPASVRLLRLPPWYPAGRLSALPGSVCVTNEPVAVKRRC